jgi:hypothetical protein
MAKYHNSSCRESKQKFLGKGEQWHPKKEPMSTECDQPYIGLEHHDHFAKKCCDKVRLIFNFIMREKVA